MCTNEGKAARQKGGIYWYTRRICTDNMECEFPWKSLCNNSTLNGKGRMQGRIEESWRKANTVKVESVVFIKIFVCSSRVCSTCQVFPRFLTISLTYSFNHSSKGQRSRLRESALRTGAESSLSRSSLLP